MTLFYSCDDEHSVGSSTTLPRAVSVAAVRRIVQKESNSTTISIVVSPDEDLELESEIVPKNRKEARIQYREGRVLFSTLEDLQETINSLEDSSPKRKTLSLLASPDMREISFNVPSRFRKLKILRCAPKQDDENLFIDGASTYHKVRVDNWEGHRHKDHELIIGHTRGVLICVPGVNNLRGWRRGRSDFDESQEDEVLKHFASMKKTSTWEQVKGLVAAVVGLLFAGVELIGGFTASAGGIYAKYSFGLHAFEIGMAGAKVTAMATAVGPAVILGVGAAAAVYFIPWESLFGWFKSLLSSLWDKTYEYWNCFKSWVKQLFLSTVGATRVPRPMQF